MISIFDRAVEEVSSLPAMASRLPTEPVDSTESDESEDGLQLTLAPGDLETRGGDGQDGERLSMPPTPGLLDQSDPAFWDGLAKMMTSPRTSPRYVMSREMLHTEL